MLDILRTQNISNSRIITILLVILISLGVGLSTYQSGDFPLFIGGAGLALVILILWLKKPSLALCGALFIIFLPVGLLSMDLQSNLNRGLTIVVIAIWLISAVRKKLGGVVISKTAILMIGFIVFGAITLFWSTNADSSISSLQRYVLRFMLFLLVFPNIIQSEKELGYLIKTIAISGWLLAAVSIYWVITNGYVEGSRLGVLAENENALGIKLIISLLGVFWLAARDSSRLKISLVLSYIYLALVIFIIAMSGSRGSAISLGATVLLCLFWKPTRRWGFLALLIAGVGLLAAPFVFSTTLERFELSTGGTVLGGREAIWQAAWNLIQLHPLTGVGLGNAENEIVPFVIILRGIGRSETIAIHNPVLAVMAETGIPGIMLYLSVLVSAVWIFLKQFLLNKNYRVQSLYPYSAILVCVFVGYMLSWIKSGGMDADYTYFLILSLLLIPTQLVE